MSTFSQTIAFQASTLSHRVGTCLASFQVCKRDAGSLEQGYSKQKAGMVDAVKGPDPAFVQLAFSNHCLYPVP